MSQPGRAFLRLGFPELSLRWQADPSQYPPTYLLHEGIQVKTSGPSSQITQIPTPSKTRPQSSRGGPRFSKLFQRCVLGRVSHPAPVLGTTEHVGHSGPHLPCSLSLLLLGGQPSAWTKIGKARREARVLTLNPPKLV